MKRDIQTEVTNEETFERGSRIFLSRRRKRRKCQELYQSQHVGKVKNRVETFVIKFEQEYTQKASGFRGKKVDFCEIVLRGNDSTLKD